MFGISLACSMLITSAFCNLDPIPDVREYEEWRHKTNEELIQGLKEHGHIASKLVENTMRTIDRRRFIARPIMNNPYWDIPQSLGYGSVMSSPKIHAQALEILKEYLKPGAKVLDIGSGSGYLTACMAHLVGPTGKVVAVEHIDDLVSQANNSMHTFYPNLIRDGRTEFILADGRDGYKKAAPYDVIYVGGAMHYYPYKLIQQLEIGGYLLASVGPYGDQSMMLYNKNKRNLKITAKVLKETKNMPLTSKERQLAQWEPIVKSKKYPKVDPLYILLQKKLRETEGKVEDDNAVHMPDMLRNWFIPHQEVYKQMKQ